MEVIVKKYFMLIVVLQLIFIGLVNAQWTAVNNGLGAHFPTSMYAMPGYPVIWLGKFGGGVFLPYLHTPIRFTNLPLSRGEFLKSLLI